MVRSFYTVILLHSHPVTQSSCYTVILSHSHLVTQSCCHTVPMWPRAGWPSAVTALPESQLSPVSMRAAAGRLHTDAGQLRVWDGQGEGDVMNHDTTSSSVKNGQHQYQQSLSWPLSRWAPASRARRFLFRYFHKNFMMCRFCSRQRSGVSSTSAKCKHKNSREFYNLEEGG